MFFEYISTIYILLYCAAKRMHLSCSISSRYVSSIYVLVDIAEWVGCGFHFWKTRCGFHVRCPCTVRSTALGLSFWSTAAGVPKLNRVTLQFSGKMERASSCHHCGQPLMMTPKRLESYNYICNVCTNRRRDADAARYIARKLADSLRRKGQPKPYPGVHFVRKVMIKCHGKSVLSGNTNSRHLCLVLQNPEHGYTVENAILVTSGESLVLTRCAKLTVQEREGMMKRMKLV
jgi:hypothetical protein